MSIYKKDDEISMNGYISLTKEEALEVLGLCSMIDDDVHKNIMKKVVQYCWERSWFEIAFKYRGVVKN